MASAMNVDTVQALPESSTLVGKETSGGLSSDTRRSSDVFRHKLPLRSDRRDARPHSPRNRLPSGTRSPSRQGSDRRRQGPRYSNDARIDHSQGRTSNYARDSSRYSSRDALFGRGERPYFDRRLMPSPKGFMPARHELRLRLENIPTNAFASDLKETFSLFGDLHYAEVEVSEVEISTGRGTVVFRPCPPNLDFLHSDIRIHGRRLRVIPVESQSFRDYRGRVRIHKEAFPCRSLSLGMMYSEYTYVQEWQTFGNVSFALDFKYNCVIFYFLCYGVKYKFEGRFKDVTQLMTVEDSEDGESIYLTIGLSFPGRFWKLDPKSERAGAWSWALDEQWIRMIDLPSRVDGYKPGQQEPGPLSPHAQGQHVKLGRWTVYRLELDKARISETKFKRMLADAADYNLAPKDQEELTKHIGVVKSSQLAKPTLDSSALNLEFDVLYMLDCLIMANCLNEYNLTDQFISRLQSLPTKQATTILEAMYLQRNRIWNPTDKLESMVHELSPALLNDHILPKHCAHIRKVVVTPTTLNLLPKTMETSNRVIRYFSNVSERFLRIAFTDESLEKVGYTPSSRTTTQHANGDIYDRIEQTLKNGIKIGDRLYEFLAFSSSQLREHGCWFFASTRSLSAADIRAWMGDFSSIHSVAKHAARMGQCFSSTFRASTLRVENIRMIRDIERNGYCFSDGVGKVSANLARAVATVMDLPTVPSAFQFRLGGSKGVLCVSNQLPDDQVHIRPSQQKFQSSHYDLEIIRTSTYIPSYLNRQVITILSALDVPDRVFLELKSTMVNALERMLHEPTTAEKTLMQNIDEYGIARILVNTIKAGFMQRKDPFVLNLLKLFRVSMLKDIKKKAKIHVPDGAFLLGVLDEVGVLEEDEIFVQIATPGNNQMRTVIQGQCIVFRNPCFHPGDVRVVKAVRREDLMYLTNVVVFSQKGDRDVPSMCSGGDLDGDDYTVIWDQNLLPPRRDHPPMDYHPPEPVVKEKVTITDIQHFYVQYIVNDNLGIIANAHLARADKSTNGARDGHYFPKSGRPALLDPELRVREYPDFMQKSENVTYPSQKVLGSIFRSVNSSDYKNYKHDMETAFVFDPRLIWPGFERYVREARDFKRRYDHALRSIMNQYGVDTECEIISGYLVKLLKQPNKKRYHEIKRSAMKASIELRRYYRTIFQDKVANETHGSSTSDHGVEKADTAITYAMASAWYYVTYHPLEQTPMYSGATNLSVRRDQAAMISFPWVLDDILCAMAHLHRRGPHDTEILQVTAKIVESYENQANQGFVVETSMSEMDVDNSPSAQWLAKLDLDNAGVQESFVTQDHDAVMDDVGPTYSIVNRQLIVQPSQQATKAVNGMLDTTEDENVIAEDDLTGLARILDFDA
ncbi:hypothetical protein BZG36_02704 [Bifiguratus adelaidae]|uniref:RNA-dependent RNA polymerase n=1 Tax=Bifiguratus adelaidae TaxID=1938954 RepID=A0A261Y1Q9_9FUNG|nr:hypothetical protein BZG36_02704 [Bifiguratus adelaidae]